MPGESGGTRCVCLRRAATADCRACRFPDRHPSYPTKDETADYLEAYARDVRAPSEPGSKSSGCPRSEICFEVICGEHTLLADNVVVATGAYNNPRVPPFARELDENIRPAPLQGIPQLLPKSRKGSVLVVGAGNSGAEIAIELAPHHQTWLSGRDTGQEPTRAGSLPDRLFTPIMWFVATRLTVNTRGEESSATTFSTLLVESRWGGCDGRTLPPRESRECRE